MLLSTRSSALHAPSARRGKAVPCSLQKLRSWVSQELAVRGITASRFSFGGNPSIRSNASSGDLADMMPSRSALTSPAKIKVRASAIGACCRGCSGRAAPGSRRAFREYCA